jgi:hypothetical protein
MGEDADVPYRKAHVNHPSTIWTRRSAENYIWHYKHFCALAEEYSFRYGKQHLAYTKCEPHLRILPGGLPYTGFTQPPQCMPDEYKDECSVKAYWNYYIAEKHTVANKDELIYKCMPL